MKFRPITYGEYSQSLWNPLNGLEDPLVVEFINRIKELDWEGYTCWVYGGILEWETHDIDATILGPLNPERINYLLDNITRIGYEMRVYPDFKWSRELFDWQEYIKDEEPVEILYAYYRGSKTFGTNVRKFAKLQNGLWLAPRTWPMRKQLAKNHNFKSPLKLF